MHTHSSPLLCSAPGPDGRKTYEDPDTVVEASAVEFTVDIHTPVHTGSPSFIIDTGHKGGTVTATATYHPQGVCLGLLISLDKVAGKIVSRAVAGLFSCMVCATLLYPLFIIGNDSRSNVFKYPVIKTMLGADDDPNQVRTSCTITSCWSILESNVQPRAVDNPIYDMRQIDKNTYTASTCNSLPDNFGPGLPAEANYCDTCGANSRKNLDYLIWCACLPYVILISAVGLKVAFEDRILTSKSSVVAACVWIWGLFTAMLGLSIKVWQNLAACKNSIAAWFLFVYPASISSGTTFSIGMYIYGWGTVSLGILYISLGIFLAIAAGKEILVKMKAAASFDN
jgi:hypothetical protein